MNDKSQPSDPQPAENAGDERESFESNITSRMNVRPFYSKSYLERAFDGYRNPLVHAQWQGWQARAALKHPVAQPAQDGLTDDAETILGVIAWLRGAAQADRKNVNRGDAADALQRLLAALQPTAAPVSEQDKRDAAAGNDKP